jgi:hypothetical protein
MMSLTFSFDQDDAPPMHMGAALRSILITLFTCVFHEDEELPVQRFQSTHARYRALILRRLG